MTLRRPQQLRGWARIRLAASSTAVVATVVATGVAIGACGGGGGSTSSSTSSTPQVAASSVLPIAPAGQGIWRARWQPGRPGVVIDAGRSKVWLTRDGGDSWRQVTPLIDGLSGKDAGLDGPRLLDVDFRDNVHGLVLIEAAVSNGWRVDVYRTSDGGVGWSALGTVTTRSAEAGERVTLSYLDEKVAHVFVQSAALTAGRLLVSDDAGTTWARRGGADTPATALRFRDATSGVGVAADRSIVVSSDGGQSWIPIESPPESPTGGAYRETPYLQEGGSLLMGRLSVEPEGLVRTWWWASAPGQPWNALGGARRSGQELEPFVDDAASVVGVELWWDVGAVEPSGDSMLSPTIDVTTNAGAGWTFAYWPYPTVTALFGIDAYVGWAVSGNGLYRTLNGGVSWQRLVPGEAARTAPTLTTASTDASDTADPSDSDSGRDSGADSGLDSSSAGSAAAAAESGSGSAGSAGSGSGRSRAATTSIESDAAVDTAN